MIKISPIEPTDIIEIKKWPHYEGIHSQMNYAIKKNGWLDHYCCDSKNYCYAAKDGELCVGFSLLIHKGVRGAEFRIAVGPDFIGKGYGKAITQKTLSIGFNVHHLNKISLIVRKNNPIAKKLYQKIGFNTCGETKENIQGKCIDFFIMQLDSNHFIKGEK